MPDRPDDDVSTVLQPDGQPADREGRFQTMLQEKAASIITSLLTAAVVAVAGLFLQVSALRGDMRQLTYRFDTVSADRYTASDARRDLQNLQTQLNAHATDIRRLEAIHDRERP